MQLEARVPSPVAPSPRLAQRAFLTLIPNLGRGGFFTPTPTPAPSPSPHCAGAGADLALANAPSPGDVTGRTLCCCAGGWRGGWERKMWVESRKQMRRSDHDDENPFPLSLMTTYHTPPPFHFLFLGYSFKLNFT